MSKKTLLLLGGSKAQLIAIRKASELGYRTVVCDYLPNNPGQHISDAFYLVSTTDKEAVLEVAKKENINGIVAYGSDPAAPTAAYVSEKLGLPGVPSSIADAFCDKHLFRCFLEEHGFNVPRSVSLEENEPTAIDDLEFPVIVKPTDSSGSKGVTVVESPCQLTAALECAFKKARHGRIIIEEFIQRDHPFVIEAEIFVRNGQVSSWGLINSIRDEKTNPLLPAGYTLPLQMDGYRLDLVRSEVSRLVEASRVQHGAFNMEMIIDKNDRLFFLDVGPRNGGNMLSEYISMASGKDIVKATLKAAVGEYEDIDVEFDGRSAGYWGLSVLHATKAGMLERICYNDKAKQALVREELSVTPGNQVNAFSICTDLVGLAFFRFDSFEHQVAVMGLDSHAVSVVVR